MTTTVEQTFAITYRALGRQAGFHLGVAAAFVFMIVLGYGCFDWAFRTAPTALQMGLWILVAVYIVGTIALHRGLTIVAVRSAVRGAPLGARDVMRRAGRRLPQQAALAFVRIIVETAPALAPVLYVFPLDWVVPFSSTLRRVLPSEVLIIPVLGVMVLIANLGITALVRTLLGPAPVLVEARTLGVLPALQQSFALAASQRGEYARLRLGVCARAFCAFIVTLGPVFIALGRDDYDPDIRGSSATDFDNGMAYLSVVVVYAFFVLDAALDTTFYVLATDARSVRSSARVSGGARDT